MPLITRSPIRTSCVSVTAFMSPWYLQLTHFIAPPQKSEQGDDDDGILDRADAGQLVTVEVWPIHAPRARALGVLNAAGSIHERVANVAVGRAALTAALGGMRRETDAVCAREALNHPPRLVRRHEMYD